MKLVFALHGMLFFMGGILLIEEDKNILAVIQLSASVLNLSMLLTIQNKKLIDNIHFLILGMNAIICIAAVVINILPKKSYMHYAWFLAAIISLLVLAFQIKSRKDEVV